MDMEENLRKNLQGRVLSLPSFSGSSLSRMFNA